MPLQPTRNVPGTKNMASALAKTTNHLMRIVPESLMMLSSMTTTMLPNPTQKPRVRSWLLSWLHMIAVCDQSCRIYLQYWQWCPTQARLGMRFFACSGLGGHISLGPNPSFLRPHIFSYPIFILHPSLQLFGGGKDGPRYERYLQ